MNPLFRTMGIFIVLNFTPVAIAGEISAIVIHDSSEVFTSGESIAPEDRLTLEQGDKISVALSTGKTMTIEGPYSGVGKDLVKAPSKIKSWKKLLSDLTQREGPSNVIGGIRELSIIPPLNLSDIPEHSFCVAPTQIVSSKLSTREVKIKSSQSGIAITLPPGNKIAWPRFFDESGKYMVFAEDGAKFLDVKIIAEYNLSSLHENACAEQYNRLLGAIISRSVE